VTSNSQYFETTYFAGFQTLNLLGGMGSQTLNLAGLDAATSLTKVSFSGADTLNADIAADTLIVSNIPSRVKVSLVGGKGNDRFEMAQTLTALDSVFISAGQGRDTLQTNHRYTAARARLAQRAGVENFLNTKPVLTPPVAAPAEVYGGSTTGTGSSNTNVDAAWAELLAAL
jgi:hypothetical protein